MPPPDPERHPKEPGSDFPTKSPAPNYIRNYAKYQKFVVTKALLVHQHYDVGSLLPCIFQVLEG